MKKQQLKYSFVSNDSSTFMSANSWAVVAGILCVTLAFGIKILPISANTTIFLEVIDGALYGYVSVGRSWSMMVQLGSGGL